MSYLAWFPVFNMICTGIAAALWYLSPQLGAWPLLLAVIPWLLRLERGGQWDWRSPFDWPILLFVATAAIGVWSAYDRETALAKLWMVVAAIFLFYAFAAFSLPEWREFGEDWAALPAWLLAVFGGVLTVYFLATHDWEALPAKIAALDSLGRGLQAPLPTLPGHRLHPNVVGGMLAMALPFAAAVSWDAAAGRRWPALLTGLLLLGVTGFGLIMTTSRGSYLAVAAAAGAALMWWLAGLFSGSQAPYRRLIFLGLIVGGVLAIGLLAALQPDLPARAGALLAGESDRVSLYRNSLDLVTDYPLIGAGLGGFQMLYSTYSYLIHVGYQFHAHNLYLDVAIEQGLPGLLALMWMWLLFAIALWRYAGDGFLGPWLMAAGLGLFTILVHGLVEDAFYGSRALMLMFVPLAFVLPYPAAAQAFSWDSRGILAMAAVGLALLIVAVMFWRPIASGALSNAAAVEQSRAELSAYSWPEWPIQDAVRGEVNLSAAIAGYERALALHATNPSANRRMGQIELSLGEYKEALEHLGQAYRQRPWDNASQQLYGEALLLNGQREAATALLQRVNNAQGQLAARAYWYETAGEKEAAEILKEIQDE